MSKRAREKKVQFSLLKSKGGVELFGARTESSHSEPIRSEKKK
jgi:hypothetical protein